MTTAFSLSAPRQVTWIVSLVVGFIGLLGYLVALPIVSVYAFWLVVVAFLLLVAATLLDGL